MAHGLGGSALDKPSAMTTLIKKTVRSRKKQKQLRKFVEKSSVFTGKTVEEQVTTLRDLLNEYIEDDAFIAKVSEQVWVETDTARIQVYS